MSVGTGGICGVYPSNRSSFKNFLVNKAVHPVQLVIASNYPVHKAVRTLSTLSSKYLRDPSKYPVAEATGAVLDQFVDLFNPDTPEDRALIKAMIVSPMWGCRPGKVPLFVISSDHGVGSGKTSTVEAIAALYGGLISTERGDSPYELAVRLASADARRMILIDNVKGRQDSQKWEAMITAQEVTLRRLHHGSFMTPNRWIWCLTANLADLSTDLASRSVIIKIGRPQHGTDFHTAYAGFLDQHRDGLVADILAYLQSPAVCEIKNPSRWQSWERAVLSRMQDGSDLAALIRARRAGVDGDTSDALDARYVIETVLTSAGFDPRYHRVHIPTAMLCPAFSENMGERITGKSLWAHLTGLLRTAPLSHCEKGRPRIGGKKTSAGLIWDPPKAQGDLRRWSDGPPSEPGIGSIIGFPSRSIESSGPEMDQQAAGDPVEAVLPGGWTTEELNALIPDDE